MTHLKDFVVVTALVRLIAEEVNLLVARLLDKLEAVRLVPPDWKHIKGYLATCGKKRLYVLDVLCWFLLCWFRDQSNGYGRAWAKSEHGQRARNGANVRHAHTYRILEPEVGEFFFELGHHG